MAKKKRKKANPAERSMFGEVFPKEKAQAVDGYFQTFTAYRPHFTTWQGGVYEAELTRSIIERNADHASKLRPEVQGTAKPAATRALACQPNPWMTTPQFLHRVSTILDVLDTCLIVPVTGADGLTMVGYYPVLPSQCEAVEVYGELWLRLMFPGGDEALIEWSRVGVLTRHQFKSDLFGDGTNVLNPTLDLMHAQEQAEHAAIEQGAVVRFIGKLSMNRNDTDQEKARRDFNRQLSADNAGGIAVYDKVFQDVKQIEPQSYTVDAEQMERIEKAAYRFFGSNESIVMNKADEDTYNAFYEGRTEVFAVQLGYVLTVMTFTPNEIARGNSIMFSANRLEFASNATKLKVATALFDRGVWSGNQVAEVFQSPPYDGGDRHVIRGEYIDLALISQHTVDDAAAAAQTNAKAAAIDKTDKGESEADAGSS